MEEELYKIFNSYINNKNYDINKLFNICLKYNKNDYLKKICIKNEKLVMGPFSYYSVKDKAIFVYINTIIELFNSDKYYDINIDASELVYYTIFHSLLHEVEHSKQTYLLQKGKNNTLEKELLSSTMLNVNEKNARRIILWKDIYTNFYDYMLLERLADYKAYKVMNNILKDKQEYIKLKYISLYQTKKSLMKGYRLHDNTVLSPTTTIINKLKDKKFYKPNDKYNSMTKEQLYNSFYDYDLKTRYIYGLPITTYEYNYLNNDLNNTRDILKNKYKIVLKQM